MRFSDTAALFEGGDELSVSVFVTTYERDDGVGLHTHPYPEVFVIERGTATFTVQGDELEAAEGNIVIVPGETTHGFRNDAEATLRVVSVHPSGTVEQTFL